MSLKHLLALFFLSLLSASAVGEEEVLSDSPEERGVFQAATLFDQHNLDRPIDHQYRRGKYLIYDCRRKFFVCVNGEGFSSCQESRDEAKEERLASLPCAPLRTFDDEEQCVLKQQKLVESLTRTDFCHQDVGSYIRHF